MDPVTEIDTDIVGRMSYTSNGEYSRNVDLSSKEDEFTPLIYYETDNSINFFYTNETNDFRSYLYRIGLTSTSATAQNLNTWLTGINHSSGSAVYSFIYYFVPGGSLNLGISYNDCALVKIDGQIVHGLVPGCDTSTTADSNFPYTFVANQPYYVEVFSINISQSYTFEFGENSGSITPFSNVNLAEEIYTPTLFEKSADKTLGASEFTDSSLVSKICFWIVLILTIVAAVATLVTYYVLGKSIVGVYSIIHYIQLLLLTPLIGHDIGNDLLDFYNQIDLFFFNFNFLGQGIVFTGKFL